MITKRLWGFEKITLSPIYFNYTRLKHALEALKDVHGQVLEEGGGAGAFTRAIKSYRKDLKITCTDFEKNLIESAKKIDTKNNYEVADIEKLKYKNKTFNAAVSFDVIEHLKNPQSAFNETYRVLKSGGVLHYAIPLEGSIFTLHGLMSCIGFKPKEKYGGHLSNFTSGDIVKMLKISGFKNISYKFSGHLIYQLTDFFYFTVLSIFAKKPDHTVEGFIEELPGGVKKGILSGIRILLSFLFFIESYIFASFPGQIGHFTAFK